jgi:cytosine/adenosine deaminase-related metal-dependent hydrolase
MGRQKCCATHFNDVLMVDDQNVRSQPYAQDIDVAFAGGELIHVGAGNAGPTPTREIDGRQLMVMPGLVNVHTHPSSEPMNKGLYCSLYTDRGSHYFLTPEAGPTARPPSSSDHIG